MKKMMKRFFMILSIGLTSLLLVSCFISNDISIKGNPIYDNNALGLEELNVYYLNDTHGAILETEQEMGLSKIGNLIKDEFDNKPDNTVFITGGDMFQGQLISNDNKGAAMIELFNEMKLDAFVIGNHEFDWGLDVILEYFNPKTKGVKANFPILGANIYFEDTNIRPDYVKPYTVVERNGIKVGIIGIMGYGLESSIMTDKIAGYEFANPAPIVRKYSKELRQKEGADIVLVASHASSDDLNNTIKGLSGDEFIDGIFNGHTHRYEVGHMKVGTMSNGESLMIPHLQAGRNGEHLGKMTFHYDILLEEDIEDKSKYNQMYINPSLSYATNLNRSSDDRLNVNNKELDVIIDRYYERVASHYNEPIINASSSRYISQEDMSNFITRAMKVYFDVDVALQNNGGTRAGFSKGQPIYGADVFKVFPFDNKIITYESKGNMIGNFYNGRWLSYYTEVDKFDYYETYRVATNDYVYSSNKNQAIEGSVVEEIDLFEFLVKVMRDLAANGHKEFYVDIELQPIK